MACIAVRDDGEGVPVEQLSKLGTRFHRLAPEAPGFGLGLASVCAIVALHGGRVDFHDARPGLEVHILLPIPNITER